MKRIMVLGSSGSGKSTLSQKLGRTLNLPVVHLDTIFWRPSWVQTPKEEFERKVEEIAQGERWIIDGNYSRTMDIRISRADLIIYLDMPRWLCMFRILKRRIMYHKKSRPDMNAGCDEKIDFEFLKWVWNYRKRSHLNTLDKLNAARDRTRVVILQNRQQVDAFLKSQV